MTSRPTLTVFTPTYNRASLLHKGYGALCRQTNKDFCWLIIDDGSTDDTKQTVENWINDGNIPIMYCYKENGGLHTGYNKAIEIMNTEICVCIDSDDWMPDNAVELIVTYWNKHKDEKIAGFIGKDFRSSGEKMGADFPEDKIMHLIELKKVKKWNWDYKPVMRVDLLKLVAPQPSFNGEKNFNPFYLMLKIDKIHPFRVTNMNLCLVDYQSTGMAANIVNQFFNSPNSFIELRRMYLSMPEATGIWRAKQYIHIVAECIIAKRSPFGIKELNNCVVAMYYVPGFLLYHYLLRRRIHNKVR